MVLIGVRIHPGNDNLLLIGHPSRTVPSRSGRQAGTGGHNSDEVLVVSRFLSSHDRPDRPPTAAKNRAPAGTDTSLQRHARGQFESRSDPDARPFEILTVRKKSQEGHFQVDALLLLRLR